jgi:heme/copper-type cytochrome/quinol oxidase subunit 4
MLFSLHRLLFEPLFLAACGYALIRGGAPERIAALTFALAATLSVALIPSHRGNFEHIELSMLGIDIGVLVTMVVLLVLAQRLWPIWMAAFQTVQVIMHAPMLLHVDVDSWAYWRAGALLSYPMLIILAVATRRHRMRIARTGADRSWRSSSAR